MLGFVGDMLLDMPAFAILMFLALSPSLELKTFGNFQVKNVFVQMSIPEKKTGSKKM